MCRSVARGEHTGDICNWLCDVNRNYTLTGFYEGGSKKVFKINLSGKDIILKMHHPFIEDYDALDVRVDDEEFTDKVVF